MAEIELRINGSIQALPVDPNETLLDVLRERLHLTGAKRGCDTGDCGACTVLLDGKPVNACLVLAVEADGAEITTVEGINAPIQERFVREGAFQCGFCAPGVVVSSTALLRKNPAPGRSAAVEALSGHLCRCTGYVRILKALLNPDQEEHEAAETESVGVSVPRKDIRDKVTGAARYTADHYFPGLLYGALVTSPQPHARILEIDARAALELPGVLLLLTAGDVPDTPYGVSPARYDETILPREVVRHVGEPVAAVFAKDRRRAEQAAARVRVTYEPLPAVFTPREALDTRAPRLHPQYEHNINTGIKQDFGHLDQVFARAAHLREDEFQGQRTHQAYLEPPAALAMEAEGVINVWTANQNPHLVEIQLARVLNIPRENLRVVTPAMGGGFGGKAETTKLEFLAVIAARRLGRPVLMTMDRKQAFLHGRGRHAQTIRLKSAFDRQGTLLGSQALITLDGGAYTSYGIITAYYSGNLLPILYKMPAFRFEARRICTNLPACGAMRGNGTPQPRFAYESHLDLAARDLGISPVEIRRRNLVEPDYRTLNDMQITSCELAACLEKVIALTRFEEKYGRLSFGRGIGLSLGAFVSGAAYPIIHGDQPHSRVRISVSADGEQVFVYTGAPEIGQGSDTVLSQIAATELSLPYDRITIRSADSGVTPPDLGTYASRVTFMAGNAAVQAARGIKTRLQDYWRLQAGRSQDALIFKNGMVTAGQKTCTFADLAARYSREQGELLAEGEYNPPRLGGTYKGAAVGTSPAYSFGAMVAEVQVDVDTGRVSVERITSVHDSGTVINPATFHGQVEGAVVMGLGETLLEEVLHTRGHLRNANFHDYLIPTIADIPEIRSATVPARDPHGPFGAKEIGEGSILPVMGAIANAVEDAVGVRIKSLPITAEKVFWGLRNRAGDTIK